MMTSKEPIQSELWRIVDELRSDGTKRLEFGEVIKQALLRGEKLRTSDVTDFLRSKPFPVERMGGKFFTPQFISQFIRSYLRAKPDVQFNTLLDIWAGIGCFSAPLTEEFNFSKAIALQENQTFIEIGTTLQDASQLEWQWANSDEYLDELDEDFDVIVGDLPFGMRRSPTSIDIKDQEVVVRDEYGRLLMLKSLQYLKEDGVGFFVTSLSFTFQRNSIRHLLNQLGFYLEAVLTLPHGTFSPFASFPGLLLIVRKQKQKQVFLAELTSDHNSQKTVLNNLMQHKNSKVLQQGIWVGPSSHLSLDRLLGEEKIKQLAKQYPYPWVELKDVAVAINLPKRNKLFEDVSNVVYLPMIGNSAATTSVNDLNVKPQNVAQLALDPDKVLASYLADFFNSPVGIKIRKSGYMGVIPKLNKTGIGHLKFPLPDLPSQGRILHLQAQLDSLVAEAERIKRVLWSQPGRQAQLQREVRKIGKEDKLEDWVDTLPYPLASILWTYHAGKNLEHRISHLLHFFEALSQFRTTIMLSAYAADKLFFAQEFSRCFTDDPKYRDWYKTATFGGWNAVGGCLGAKTRSLLSDNEKKEICLRLFASPDTTFLDIVDSRKLTAILKEVEAYRNSWKGHGGIAGKSERKRRITLLETALAKTRRIISDVFEMYDLVLPESNQYTDGTYYFVGKSIMGTRTPFRKVEFESIIPLDSKKLYFRHIDSLTAIELLPLFRIMESPKTEQDACYFYNRIQGHKVRWVSYHFESEAEIIRPDPEVRKALALFEIDKQDFN